MACSIVLSRSAERCLKMSPDILLFRLSKASNLEREAIHNAQRPHDHSARSFLVFLHLELARVERELEAAQNSRQTSGTKKRTDLPRIIFREHRRKDTFLQPFIRRILVLAPVDEHILLSRMTMEITVENHVHFGHEPKGDSLLGQRLATHAMRTS